MAQRELIISWLKANGMVFQEDFIEIIFKIINGDCKLLYDVLTDTLCIIDYDSKGSVLEVETLKTEKQFETAIEMFEICE